MKKLLSVLSIAIIVFASLFALTGCGNEKKENKNVVEISYASGKGKYTVAVPKKDDGSAKYNFTNEKPEALKGRSAFYLETENAYLAFGTSGLVYNTSIYYKQKYGEAKATFDGYLAWAKDPDSKIMTKDMQELEINGRKAVRREMKNGSSGNYEYLGYSYMIAADDIIPGSYVNVDVYFKKGEEKITSPKELDDETKDIINSFKAEVNQ